MPGFDRATAIGVGDARIGLAPVPFRSQRTMLVSDKRFKVGQLVYEVNNNRFVGHAGGGLWIPFGGGGAPLNSLTGDDSIVVLPVANNINVQGGLTGAIQFSSGGPGQLNAAVQVDNTTITIVGGQLTLAGGGGAITFNTNAAPATVAAGVIQILGNAAQGVSTSGAGNIVTVTVANATTASKGVAQFNPTDFTVTGGVVSLSGTATANLTTLNTTPTTLFTFPMADGTVTQFDILIAAYNATAPAGAGYALIGASRRQAGVVTILNAVDFFANEENPPFLNLGIGLRRVNLVASGTNTIIQVTGLATAVDWVATIRYVTAP